MSFLDAWRLGAADYAVLAFTFAASLWGTRATIPYAMARGVLDVPNDRSLHRNPTPRGGGMPLVVIWTVVLAWLGATSRLSGHLVMVLAGAVPIALVGWVDDHRSLPRSVRFCAQMLCAAWAVAWLGGMPQLVLGTVVVPLGAFGAVLATLFLVWVTNLYNFMDGSDGLAGVQAGLGGSFAAVIFLSNGLEGLGLGAAALSVGALGFLWSNWPPARIFLGDVGSNLLGFAFGALVLAGERSAGLGLVLVLPFLVFGVDATVTLLRRLLSGRRLVEAHCSHAYQRLIKIGWSHVTVALSLGGMILILGPLAVWAAADRARVLPTAAALSGVLIVAMLLVPGAGSESAEAVKTPTTHSE